MIKHNDRRVKNTTVHNLDIDNRLTVEYEEMEGLPLLELRGLLLVIIFVVVEFVSLRSTGTIVTMRRLHQDLKV